MAYPIWPRIAAYGVCAAFLLAGIFGDFHYPDEGFYVLAGQSAFGSRPLYSEVPYFHMPGFAVVVAGLQAVVGPDLTLLRLALAVVAFAALLLIGAVVRRERGPEAETIYGVLAAASPFMLTTLPTIASYSAVAGLMLALCAYGLVLRSPSGAALAGVGIGLATACRVAYAPAAGLLLIALWRRDGLRTAAIFAATAATSLLALAGWWLLRDPAAAWHNVIAAQLERARWTPYLWTVDPWRSRLDVAFSLLLHLFAPLIVTMPLWRSWFARRRAGATDKPALLGVLIVGAVLAHFVPTPSYLVYFVSLVPLILAVCAIAVAGRGIRRFRGLLAGAALVGLCAQDTVFVHGQPYPLAWTAELAGVIGGEARGWDRAVAALRERTPEGATVWSFDTSLVVQAGRRVPPGFEMSYFAFYPKATPEYAAARRILDPSRALAPLRAREVAAVVASKKFAWDVLRNDAGTRATLWRQICGGYQPEVRFADAVYGEIWLLMPREAAAVDPCCERLFEAERAGPASCPEAAG